MQVVVIILSAVALIVVVVVVVVVVVLVVFVVVVVVVRVKVKVMQSLYRPRGFQEVNALRFYDNRRRKVVSPTDRPTLFSVNIPGTHLC